MLFSYFNIIISVDISYCQYKKRELIKQVLILKKKKTFLDYASSLQKKKIIALAGGRKVDLIIPSYPRVI